MKKIIVVLFAILITNFSLAEIIQVSGVDGDTPTAYWPSNNSKAVLIWMPGGEGSFNIAAKNPAKPSWVLSLLYEASQNNAGLDLVFVDSPYPLGMQRGYIAPRYSNDHLSRMFNVVKFYKEKTKKPIYIIGHSNGTISLSEFLKQSPDNQKLIAGVIFSGTRREVIIDGPLNIPVLFLHHENDANVRWTSFENAETLYAKTKDLNIGPTLFSVVHGGEAGGDPGSSGYHMYEGSFQEAANHIWNFIFKQNMPKY